jgi:hypothetical protein
MAEAPGARKVRVVPSEDGEVHVPAEIAELLGADAELEVGPGTVVILRSYKGAQGPIPTAAGSVLLDGFDVQRRPYEAKARMGVQLQWEAR